MKKLIISLFIAFSCLTSKAQSYIPMVEDSMILVNEFSNVFHPLFNKYKVLGDTIINGTSYFKCYADTVLNDSTYSLTSSMEYYGAIREENKRVFFLINDSLDEKKIYDFSITAGDTTELYFKDHFTNTFANVILDRIDTIPSFYGRKNYYYNGYVAVVGQVIATEGFGNLIYEANEIDTSVLSKRFCSIKKNNNTHNIPANYSQCYQNIINSYISIPEYSLASLITLYPNPSSGSININSGEIEISNIELFDLQGKRINAFQYNNTTQEIDISFLQQGIYLLRITTIKGETVSKKIIKE